MASPQVVAALSRLEDASVPQTDKTAAYNEILRRITSATGNPTLVDDLNAFIDAILGDTIGIVAARPLLASAVQAVKALPNLEDQISVGQHALDSWQSRVASFEDQDASMREILADAYQQQEEWRESARVLQGINLESSQRKVPDNHKVRIFMRICRLYLEAGDSVAAESYLNRAKNLIYKVKDEALSLEFNLSQARILDSHRRFLEASSQYHDISVKSMIADDERMRCLSAAITCAVLAPAGPQRARALGRLYKDERASQVNEFGILEKMFLDQLLSPEEVDRFAGNLEPHQLATTSDGTTVLAKAVVEHNLLSASRLYANIGFEELGILLGCNKEKAEFYAAAMLEQGRLNGHIDQIDDMIFFHSAEGMPKSPSAGQARKAVGPEIRRWDAKVRGIAEDVERVASILQSVGEVN